VGVRASNDHGLQCARQLQVRDIVPFTAKEALIFLPDQPCTDHSLAPIARNTSTDVCVCQKTRGLVEPATCSNEK